MSNIYLNNRLSNTKEKKKLKNPTIKDITMKILNYTYEINGVITEYSPAGI